MKTHEYKDFAKFARDLYLHSNESLVQVKELDQLHRSPFMDKAVQVLDLFTVGHSNKFVRLLKKTLPASMKTEEDLMRFAIPKCLKLFDQERYFYSLMLVVGFLAELQEYLQDKKGCYLFSQSGYKCLIAVFDRRFRGAFRDHGGFKGLDNYMVSVLSSFNGDKMPDSLINILNGGDENLRKRVGGLVRNCHDPKDVDFTLNDFELSMVSDFQATKKKWFDPDMVDNSSMIPEDKSIIFSKEEVKLVSDAEKKLDESTRDASYNDLDSFSLPFTDDLSYFSDFDTSWSENSEPHLENILESVAAYKLRLEKPDLYDRKMSSVHCRFCGENCYQYAKYILRKHCQLAIKEGTSKWKLVMMRLASKIKTVRRLNFLKAIMLKTTFFKYL